MDQKALVQQMMVKAVHAAAKAQEEMLDEKLHELDGYVAIGRPPARVLCCVLHVGHVQKCHSLHEMIHLFPSLTYITYLYLYNMFTQNGR